ncbi:MAG: ABC transporter permease [Methylobacteriaceae bacterium]|jgi:lipopolysaccharide transport system permease protein|nr:ABC transporter permease [Methylobacteriaceae bacterium]
MRKLEADGTEVTIYRPNERQGGFLWGVRQAAGDIHASRYIILRLFLRDFKAQYKQKLLGYFWAFISPLLGVLSFLFLYISGVLVPGEGEIPYTLYVLTGSCVWSCLPGALAGVSGGLAAQADLIMRTRIPKISLAVSALSNLYYAIMTNMVTVLVVLLLYGMAPSWWFILYPVLVLPMVLLGASAGLVLSVLGIIARDLTSMVQFGLSLVMYVTPVIYLRDTITNPLIKTLITYNPLTYLVDTPRSLIITGHAENGGVFLLLSAAACVCAVVCIRVFYLIEDLAAERL